MSGIIIIPSKTLDKNNNKDKDDENERIKPLSSNNNNLSSDETPTQLQQQHFSADTHHIVRVHKTITSDADDNNDDDDDDESSDDSSDNDPDRSITSHHNHHRSLPSDDNEPTANNNIQQHQLKRSHTSSRPASGNHRHVLRSKSSRHHNHSNHHNSSGALSSPSSNHHHNLRHRTHSISVKEAPPHFFKDNIISLRENFTKFILFLSFQSILEPNAIIKIIWDYYIIILALYQFFFTTWYIAFDTSLGRILYGFDWFVTISFLFDILITFRTGYIDYSGNAIFDSRLIAERYIHSFVFALDLLSTFPFHIISPAFHFHSSMNNHNHEDDSQFVDNCLKLNFLLRTSKIINSVRIDSFISPQARIGKLLFGFFCLAHLFGSIFWFVGMVQTGDVSWIHQHSLETKDHTTQYIASLYWALTTMVTVGYGDIVPVTVYEQATVIPILMLSALIYATIFGNMAYAIETITSTIRRYQSRMDSIKEFVKVYELPPELQQKLYDYTNAQWTQTKGFETNEMLSHLPTSVRADIMMYIQRTLIERVPLFKQCSDRFLEAMILRMTSQVCLTNDYIFKEGDKSREMYFVRSGSVEIIMEVHGVDRIIADIGSYSDYPFFGEISLLLGETRTASARAATKCILSKLSQQDFFEVLSMFPEEENSLRETATLRLEQDIERENKLQKREKPGNRINNNNNNTNNNNTAGNTHLGSIVGGTTILTQVTGEGRISMSQTNTSLINNNGLNTAHGSIIINNNNNNNQQQQQNNSNINSMNAVDDLISNALFSSSEHNNNNNNSNIQLTSFNNNNNNNNMIPSTKAESRLRSMEGGNNSNNNNNTNNGSNTNGTTTNGTTSAVQTQPPSPRMGVNHTLSMPVTSAVSQLMMNNNNNINNSIISQNNNTSSETFGQQSRLLRLNSVSVRQSLFTTHGTGGSSTPSGSPHERSINNTLHQFHTNNTNNNNSLNGKRTSVPPPQQQQQPQFQSMNSFSSLPSRNTLQINPVNSSYNNNNNNHNISNFNTHPNSTTSSPTEGIIIPSSIPSSLSLTSDPIPNSSSSSSTQININNMNMNNVSNTLFEQILEEDESLLFSPGASKRPSIINSPAMLAAALRSPSMSAQLGPLRTPSINNAINNSGTNAIVPPPRRLSVAEKYATGAIVMPGNPISNSSTSSSSSSTTLPNGGQRSMSPLPGQQSSNSPSLSSNIPTQQLDSLVALKKSRDATSHPSIQLSSSSSSSSSASHIRANSISGPSGRPIPRMVSKMLGPSNTSNASDENHNQSSSSPHLRRQPSFGMRELAAATAVKNEMEEKYHNMEVKLNEMANLMAKMMNQQQQPQTTTTTVVATPTTPATSTTTTTETTEQK